MFSRCTPPWSLGLRGQWCNRSSKRPAVRAIGWVHWRMVAWASVQVSRDEIRQLAGIAVGTTTYSDFMGCDVNRPPRNVALIMVAGYSLALAGLVFSGVSELGSSSDRTLTLAGLVVGVAGFLLASSMWLRWAWTSGTLHGTSSDDDERAAAHYYEDRKSYPASGGSNQPTCEG